MRHESDERRESLKEIIKSSADSHGVNVQMLDANSLKENDTDILNDLIIANEWIDTQLDADGFLYQSYNQKEVEEITTKYGTPYLMSVVVISVRQSNPISRFLNRKTKSFIFVSVYDVNTGSDLFLSLTLQEFI